MAEAQLDLLAPHAPDSRFVIRKSARARHMAISVGAHGVVEVVVPRNVRPAEVEQFVTQHRQWIDRALGEMSRSHPPIDRAMPDAFVLPGVDETWSVEYDARRLAANDGVITVPASREDRPRCREHLQRWLKEHARFHFLPRLAELAASTGMQFDRVQVRGQRTRWGSYSSSGTLSLNYCLLFLAPELVRHLMLHELCHSREMNHSRRFWRLLARHQPDFRDLERRLDRAWTDVPGWVGLH